MIEEYYKVDGEAKNLLEESWDFLVVLDVCLPIISLLSSD